MIAWDLVQVLRVELIHRDHVSSSMRSATIQSTSDIVVAAVKRAHERRTRLSNHLLAAGQLFTTPVASGNGEYLVDISYGTPPQKSTAIVDTGSDLNWVQCLPCESCYSSTSAKFDPSKSDTYKTIGCTSNLCTALPYKSCTTSCQYDYLYGDGSSTSGALSSETVRAQFLLNLFKCQPLSMGSRHLFKSWRARLNSNSS